MSSIRGDPRLSPRAGVPLSEELGAIDAIEQRPRRTKPAAEVGSAGRAFGRGDVSAASNLLRRATLVLPPSSRPGSSCSTELAEAEIERASSARPMRPSTRRSSAAWRSTMSASIRAEALVRYQLRNSSARCDRDTDEVTRAGQRMIPISRLPVMRRGLSVPGGSCRWRVWEIGALEDAADAAGRSGGDRVRFRRCASCGEGRCRLSTGRARSPMPVSRRSNAARLSEGAVGLDRIVEAQFLAIRASSSRCGRLRDSSDGVSPKPRDHRRGGTEHHGRGRRSIIMGRDARRRCGGRRDGAVRDLAILEIGRRRYYPSSVAGLLGHALYASVGMTRRPADGAEELAGEDDVLQPDHMANGRWQVCCG